MPQKFRDTLKSLHREFIWNGKKAEIKHSSLIGEYRDGGLQDVDIDRRILALKILWVRQLKDSNFHPWKVLANHLLSPVGGEAIFHTNLCLSERFRQRTNDLKLFYKELVLTWEKYSVSESLTVGQIATQSLWNNEFIHAKSESLYDESLVSKGIMTVSNLFDNEGELKNWETASQEFSLNPIHFLKWYGVLKSIPSCWKKTLKGYNTEDNTSSEEESQCGIEANGKFIPLNSVTAKLVYKLRVSQKFSPPTSKKLLSNKFNIDGVFFSSLYNCFVLILQNRQPHSLCSHIYRQCCFFALRVQDLLHACDRSVCSVVVV